MAFPRLSLVQPQNFWDTHRERDLNNINQGHHPPHLLIGRYIPDGARIVLDVGGGDGNALALYAEQNPLSEVFICDADIINLARVPLRDIGNLRPIFCQADLLPFEHGVVSAIFSLFMVEHLNNYNYSNFLLKAYELLEPGGVLIIASDSAIYDKYMHPVERLIRERVRRTSGFLERYDVTKIKIHHHNLKNPTHAMQFIARHGFFVQDLKLHLIAGRHSAFAFIYELLPKVPYDLLSTIYVVIAQKPHN